MRTSADLILYNAVIYTVNSNFSVCEAMAVKENRIMMVGTHKEVFASFIAKRKIDVKGAPIFPGFIDAHAHFYYYGQSLQSVSLKGCKNWEEAIKRVVEYGETHSSEWLLGRGWDHFEWDHQKYPNNEKLNQLFPDRPVFLIRVDEHAAIANRAALEKAGIVAGQMIGGGEIHEVEGKLTGLLVDNALELIKEHIPEYSAAEKEKCLLEAQENCFAVGLTTIDDCGLDREMIAFIDHLQKEKKLKMRLFIMISDKSEHYDYYLKKGPYKTDRLNISSFKLFSDGALGSRGAAMLQPYSDSPNWKGFFVHDRQHFAEVAKKLASSSFQMCTHAIGDAANRMILEIYSEALKGQNNRHWRIEHAQFIHKDDFHLFGDFQIIPSVQPTHATTDMHWAKDRVGQERMSGSNCSETYAYAYKSLLEQNGWLPLGTDFPVEDINPMTTFYAAVTRKDRKGLPEKGFLPHEALSRKEALQGITIWPAKLNFEEKQKGSLEAGKFADFVILDRDIMQIPIEATLQAKVQATFLGGEQVF